MQEHNDLAQVHSNEIAKTPLQPMDFTDILDGMFSFYRSHFRLFLKIIAVYFVLAFGIELIFAYFATFAASSVSILMSGLMSVIAIAVISILVTAGLMYASAHVYLSREITPETALQRAWQRFWTYLGSAILWSFVVVGLAVTVIGIPFSIYFSVRWGLYSLPVLFEGTTARNALRRSTELVKGSWWRVFGVMLAISVISFMIYFILEASSGFLLSYMGVSEAGAPTGFLDTLRQLVVPTLSEIGWFSYVVRRLVSLSISVFTMPIGAIGATLLYFDLRIRKEAFDIEMQVTD